MGGGFGGLDGFVKGFLTDVASRSAVLHLSSVDISKILANKAAETTEYGVCATGPVTKLG